MSHPFYCHPGHCSGIGFRHSGVCHPEWNAVRSIYETRQVDAFGIRNFGSTMPVCKQPVAAFALYAFVALVELGSKEQDPVKFSA